MSLKELVEDNATLLVSSAIDRLPTAIQIVAKSGAKLAMVSFGSEDKEILLIGRSCKGSEASDAVLAKVKSADTSVEDAMKDAVPSQSRTVIDLTQALHQDRKAA